MQIKTYNCHEEGMPQSLINGNPLTGIHHQQSANQILWWVWKITSLIDYHNNLIPMEKYCSTPGKIPFHLFCDNCYLKYPPILVMTWNNFRP